MSNIRIELNSAGVQELLKCDAIQQTLMMYARDVNTLTDGNVEVRVGKKRAYTKRVKDDTQEKGYDK